MKVYETAEALLDAMSFGGNGGGLWMHDWSGYASHYDWSGSTTSVPTNSWGTLLNVADGPGFLTFARSFAAGGATSAENPNIRVTVDGVAYTFSGASGAPSALIGNMLLAPIPYKTTLKVEAFNRDTGSARSLGLDYTYLSKAGIASSARTTLLSAGTRSMGFGTTASATMTTVANITGAGWLIGLATDTYGTANSNTTMTIVVDGVTKMAARTVGNPQASTYKQQPFVGPIRFNTSLQIQHASASSVNTVMTREWHLLD
jgi:hypothetical protein